MKLAIESESYSPQGNISAEGISKLLGAPDLDRLEAVIRESAQNSWDARRDGATPEYRLHLRKLSESQCSVLQELFSELPDEPGDAKAIKQFLSQPDGWVLEISDFFTSGLGGPVFADEVPRDGETTNFVDFLRNIGSPRDIHHGGGTYGYGKSSLYAASRCNTILVDTIVPHGSTVEHRLIGSMIGSRFDATCTDSKGRRYTGRHWWGLRPPDSPSVIPVTGNAADRLSDRLGNRAGIKEVTGTTILILDPDTGTGELPEMGNRMIQVLLEFFWPKMVEVAGQGVPMNFKVLVDGEEQPLPDPSGVPGLALLVDCLRRVRTQAEDSTEISSQRPRRRLGRCAFSREIRIRQTDKSGIWPKVDQDFHHVALMRPAELVVKYLPGVPIQNGRVDWGGVFICDTDDEVEQAFASAEPPAHDDWNPANLPTGPAKSMVTVALRQLKNEMKDYSEAASGKRLEIEGETVPLGALADEMGRGLMLGKGGRLGGVVRPRGGGNRTRKKRGAAIHLSNPLFKGLEEGASGQPSAAVFEIDVSKPVGKRSRVEAVPKIVWDLGGREATSSDLTGPDGEVVRILGWRAADENIKSRTSIVEVPAASRDVKLEVLVSSLAGVAVSVSLRVIDTEEAQEADFPAPSIPESNAPRVRESGKTSGTGTSATVEKKRKAGTAKKHKPRVKTQPRKKPRRGSGSTEPTRSGVVQAFGGEKAKQKRIQARKEERARARSAPLSSPAPAAISKRVACGCQGEVENCQRCYGKGYYFVDQRGNIVG